jgi:hypothetical protein
MSEKFLSMTLLEIVIKIRTYSKVGGKSNGL